MKRFISKAVLVLAIAFFSTGATADCSSSNPMFRPLPNDYLVYGAVIPGPWGIPYQVKVGDLIEMDISITMVPGAPESYEIKLIKNQAIHWASPKKRRVNINTTGGCTMAYYFKATNPGTAQVVLSISGQEFTYSFQVNK
jgi:hypothetical protein